MASIIDQSAKEIRIDSNADELLDCFSEEIAHIVYQVAEHIAMARAQQVEQYVVITEEDVRQAGEKVVGVLKGAVAKGELDRNAGEMLDMLNCTNQRDT